jgi:hypothetical protein
VLGELSLVTIGKQRTGTVLSSGSFQYEPGETDERVWTRPEVPMDGTPLVKTTPPLLPLLVLTYTYATAGIVFAVVCMVFNIVFRKKTSVDANDMHVMALCSNCCHGIIAAIAL